MKIGQIVVKIAGRDAGKKGVILDIIDDRYALIDGETRKRKVNVVHLEPLDQIIKIKKNATHKEVSDAFKSELGITLPEKKKKPKTDVKADK